MTEPAQIFSTIHLRLSEIARGIDVSTATCSTWRRRHADFPVPSRSGAYVASAVIAWLDRREIPSAYRNPQEPDGTTYGDRLRRALAERLPTKTYREIEDKTARQALVVGLPKRFRDVGTNDSDYLDACLLLIFTWICSERHWDRIAAEARSHTSADRPTALLNAVAAAVDEALRLYGLPIGASDFFDGLRKARTTDIVALIENCGRAGRSGFDHLLAQLLKVVPVTSRDYCTPVEVARFMAACVTHTGKPVGTVLDPYTRLGELPLAVLEQSEDTPAPRVKVFGRRPTDARRAGLNLAVHGCAPDIRISDRQPWQYPVGGPYDAIVVNPPFNESFVDSSQGTDWPFGTPPSHSHNFAWVQAVIAALTEDGRAAVLMPAAAGGSNNRRESEIRQEMLERGALHAVVRLPAQVFPASSVDTAVWVLRRPLEAPREVLFADVRAMTQPTPGSRPRLADLKRIADLVNDLSGLQKGVVTVVEHGGRAISASIDTIRGARYSLVPDDYLTAAPTDADERWRKIGASESGMIRALSKIAAWDCKPPGISIERTMPEPDNEYDKDNNWREDLLAELCEIKSGPSNTYDIKYEPDGEFPILKAKHIHPRHLEVPGPDSRTTAEVAGRLEKFDVVENDILFVRVGQVGDAAVARAEHRQSFFATNVIRLRIRKDVELNPEYLLEWLLCTDTRNRIRSRAAINSVPSISGKDLGQFVVRYPRIDQQRLIATTLQELDLRAKAYLDAAARTEEYRTAVAEGLLTGAVGITEPS